MVKGHCKPLLKGLFAPPKVIGGDWVGYGAAIDEALGFYLILRKTRSGTVFGNISVSPILPPDQVLEHGLTLRVLHARHLRESALLSTILTAVSLHSRATELAVILRQKDPSVDNNVAILSSHGPLRISIEELIRARSSQAETRNAAVKITKSHAAVGTNWSSRSDYIRYVLQVTYGYRFVRSTPSSKRPSRPQ